MMVVFYGGIGSHTQARVDAAAKELIACPELHAALVGGARPHRNYDGSRDMAAKLTAAGVDPHRLHVAGPSFHSWGNLETLGPILQEHPVHSIVFVSDALHVWRLMHTDGPHHEKQVEGLLVVPSNERIAFWWRTNYEVIALCAGLLPRMIVDRVLSWVRR